MAAARRRGKNVGRPPVLTPEKLDMAERLLAEGKGRDAATGAQRERDSLIFANMSIEWYTEFIN